MGLFIYKTINLLAAYDLMYYTKMMKPLNVLGLTLFFAGSVILAGFGLYKFFEDSTVPAVVRWGIVAVILGVIIILISLIKERSKERDL